MVNLEGWCGHCGESFRLAQVVTEGADGRCPRCGTQFNSHYTAVVTASVTELLVAYHALLDAAQRVRETAPLIHVDRAAMYKALDEHLDR